MIKDPIKPKITQAFRNLRKQGIFTRQNWQCCQGCGCAALPEGTDFYVFYHRQDTEHLRDRNYTYITWGSSKDLPEKEMVEFGEEVVRVCELNGLRTTWDKKTSSRILLGEAPWLD